MTKGSEGGGGKGEEGREEEEEVVEAAKKVPHHNHSKSISGNGEEGGETEGRWSGKLEEEQSAFRAQSSTLCANTP